MTGPAPSQPRDGSEIRGESRLLHSEHTGASYRIDVALPSGTPSAAGWPSIWLLDAADCFGTCVEAVRRMSRRPDATGVHPMIVVGISSSAGHDVVRRRRDFTPPAGGSVDAEPPATGGSPQFLAFIEQELKSDLARRFPFDPDGQALMGHSLAGFFALWALTQQTATFSAYAAISPSLWWNRDLLDRGLATFRANGQRVFLAVGEWEGALPPWQKGLPRSEEALARRLGRRMIPGTREFAESLAPLLGQERVRFEILADEDHASIISSAIPRILRFISGTAPR